jgi:hypothetical protein
MGHTYIHTCTKESKSMYASEELVGDGGGGG